MTYVLLILGQSPGQYPPMDNPHPSWTKPPWITPPRTKPLGQNPLDKTPPDKTLRTKPPWTKPPGQNPPDKTDPEKTPKTTPPSAQTPPPPYKTPRTQTTTAKPPRINPRSQTKFPEDKNLAKSKVSFIRNSFLYWKKLHYVVTCYVCPSVCPSSMEISLERGCTITIRPIDLNFGPNIGVRVMYVRRERFFGIWIANSKFIQLNFVFEITVLTSLLSRFCGYLTCMHLMW